MPKVLLVACAAVSGLLAGCVTTVHSTPIRSSTPRTVQLTPDARSLARHAAEHSLLTLSDFPAGWSSHHSDSGGGGGNSKKLLQQFADCLHAPASLFSESKTSVSVDSPDFKSPDGRTTIDETIDVANPTNESKGFAVLQEPQAPQCFAQVFRAVLSRKVAKHPPAPGVTLGHVTVDRLSLTSGAADTTGIRAQVPLSGPAGTIVAYIDIGFIGSGSAEVTLLFTSVGAPTPAATESQLAHKAVDKLSPDTTSTVV